MINLLYRRTLVKEFDSLQAVRTYLIDVKGHSLHEYEVQIDAHFMSSNTFLNVYKLGE